MSNEENTIDSIFTPDARQVETFARAFVARFPEWELSSDLAALRTEASVPPVEELKLLAYVLGHWAPRLGAQPCLLLHDETVIVSFGGLSTIRPCLSLQDVHLAHLVQGLLHPRTEELRGWPEGHHVDRNPS